MAKLQRLRFLGIALFMLLFSSSVIRTNATHIIGGELIYDCIGPNTYRLTLKVYRDCNPGTAAYDNPAYISIWDGSGSPLFIDTVAIPFPGAIVLPIVSTDPCFIAPSGVCVEEAIYQTVVTLPVSPTGYIFAYQRCCRNNSIINILDPGNTGTTYYETVPVQDSCNNSPRYTNFPPIALCINQPLVFDHSATDPDGDSLVYYICSPYIGADAFNSQPQITSAPPFNPITFIPPFTALDPISGAPPLAIDPVTGILTLTPTQLGQFVVGICCDEYRNGVLIGTHTRDFQFNVTNCPPTPTLQFSSGTIEGGIFTPDSVFTEGCEQGVFIFSRQDTSSADTIFIIKGGNAIEGSDYDPIVNTLIIPQGVFADSIIITANADGLDEGTDTLILSMSFTNPCDTGLITLFRKLYIQDYIPIVAIMDGDTTLCPGGIPPLLNPIVTGGFGNYHYTWYPTGDTTATSNATMGTTTVYYVNIEDDCEKAGTSTPVTIVIQCPIIIPNVITANDDGLNDIFFIQNIEQYPENEVWFYNRWGTLLHYEKSYKNDWKPDVVDGVYFYVVDDKVNEPFKGFFTVFKN